MNARGPRSWWKSAALVVVALAGVASFALSPSLPRLFEGTPAKPEKDPLWAQAEGFKRVADTTVVVRFWKGRAEADVETVMRLRRDDPLVDFVRSGRAARNPGWAPSAFTWFWVDFGVDDVESSSRRTAPVLLDRGGEEVSVRAFTSYSASVSKSEDVCQVGREGHLGTGHSLSVTVEGGTVVKAAGGPNGQDQRSVRYDALPEGSLRVVMLRDGADPTEALGRDRFGWIDEAARTPLGMVVPWLTLVLLLPGFARGLRGLAGLAAFLGIFGPPYGVPVPSVMSAVVPMLALACVHEGRRPVKAALAWGGAGLAFMIAELAGLGGEITGAAALPVAGLLWAPFAYAVTRLSKGAIPGWAVALFSASTAAAFLFLPMRASSQGLSSGGVTVDGYGPSSDVTAGALVHLLMLAALAVVLLGRGSEGSAVDDRQGRALGLAWCVVAFTFYYGLLSAVVGLIAALWLLPREPSGSVGRLASVTPAVHARLMRLEARRRVLQAAARALRRQARDPLAAGELQTGEFDARLRALEADGRPRRGKDFVDASKGALGSGGGFTPRQNGVSAFRAGLLLDLPYGFYSARSLLLPERYDQLVLLAEQLLHMLSLSLLAFVFGYFYPRLRGRGPLGKAACMLVATLLVQATALSGLFGPFGDYVLPGLAISAGNAIAFWIVLGLYWEYRLVRAANLPWSVLREIRHVQSLSAPLTAVLVAVVTVLASTTANAWLPPQSDGPSMSAPPGR